MNAMPGTDLFSTSSKISAADVLLLIVYSVLYKQHYPFYFLAYFNNSHTVLKRIVSRFRFSIQNPNPTVADSDLA